MVTGSRSHKSIDEKVSAWLRLYYDPVRVKLLAVNADRSRGSRTDPVCLQKILFAVCAGNELFYVAWYLCKWVHTPLWQSLDIPVNVVTTCTWAELMFWVCLPVCAFKNIINLVQLWKASKILVGVDLAERAKARE